MRQPPAARLGPLRTFVPFVHLLSATPRHGFSEESLPDFKSQALWYLEFLPPSSGTCPSTNPSSGGTGAHLQAPQASALPFPLVSSYVGEAHGRGPTARQRIHMP